MIRHISLKISLKTHHGSDNGIQSISNKYNNLLYLDSTVHKYLYKSWILDNIYFSVIASNSGEWV